MLYNVRVFLSPNSELGVRLEGKAGKEAKDIVNTKEQYKEYQKELNRALDNLVFKKLSAFLGDHQFDIDNAQDRESMKVVLDGLLMKNPVDEVKQSYIDAKNLLADLDQAYQDKVEQDDNVINNTRTELTNFSTSLADFNNNGITGTEVRNTRGYNRKTQKQEEIFQDIKDIKDRIRYVLAEKDALIVNSLIDKGVLPGIAFRNGLKKMYRDAKYPTYKNMSKEEKKNARDDVNLWINYVEKQLRDAGLWDDARYVNRKTKTIGRLESGTERKTRNNKNEILFTEEQFKGMLDGTAMIMGKDPFAEALYNKVSLLRPDANLPEWSTMDELQDVLADENNEQVIRGVLYDNLPYMTVSSLKEWLTAEKPGELLNTYRAEIEKQHAVEVNTVLEALYPNLTQAEMQQKRGQVIAMVAAGIMEVSNRASGMEVQGKGAGVGITFTGIENATKLISRISIGAGMTDKGIPGFAIDFGKDFKWGSGRAYIDAGAANFLIPFARVGVDQTINMGALENNLKAKRAWKLGVFAEAVPAVYAGVGINIGSNLLSGIDQQQQMIESNIKEILNTGLSSILSSNLDYNVKIQSVKSFLANKFTKAENKTLDAAAKHIVDGAAQGYTIDDIAATFAAAWKNEALKKSKGKVDVSAEIGAGMLLTVPVLKAFIGLRIYKRSTMRTDLYDRDAKEQQLSRFNGFERFENPDVLDMSIKEKVAYWLGDKAVVTETDKTITISSVDPSKAIYDQFDIFVKDPQFVKLTKTELTFSKASNILMAKLVQAHGTREKIYVGYDKQADVDAVKFPMNREIKGNPQNVIERFTEETIEEKTLSFDSKESINIYADYFDKVKLKCIEATNQVQKKKYEYNAFCQDLINEINRFGANKNATETQWQDVVGSFNQLMNRIGAESLNVQPTDPKNFLMSQMLNTIAYSIKAWNLNIANPKRINSKNLPNSLAALINRKGAIQAFNNGGYELTATSFDALHATVKTETTYKQVKYPNAFAAVAYYRNVAPKTPMNVTSLTGLDNVTLGHNSNSGELFKDSNVEANAQSRLIENILNNPQEFAAYKARVNAMLQQAAVDYSTFTDASYAGLLKGEKVNGVTLSKEYFKAFNGPCFNEAIVLNLLGIHVDKRTSKKPIPADIYVGMENTENYQNARSVNLGVGTMYGNKPQQPTTPETPTPGNPGSNPVDNATNVDGNVNVNPSHNPGDNRNNQNP